MAVSTFLKWCEEKNLDLPVFTDSPEPEDATEENTKRAGISANYPDAYIRAQYPHKYFNPITSTADGKLAKKMGS